MSALDSPLVLAPLTIDSAIVLAAFDQANEVTHCFHQTHTQDHEEAIEVSSEETVLEGSDAGGHHARGEEEARRRAASPVLHRGKTHKRANKVQERRIPLEFWENVPPRFIPFLIEEGGCMKQARYVTIHMEKVPYTLGMARPNAPIHHLPAVVAPHPTGSTTPCYALDDLRTLHPMYTQRLDINNAMRRTRHDGLMAEVHRYRNLVDEQAQKQVEVDRLNNRLSDIILDLRRCVLCLTRANAVQCIEAKRGEVAHHIGAWSFE